MDEKTAFRQRMESQLQAWEAELDHWRLQGESTRGDPQLRREQQQMLDDLHEKRMQARHYLDDLNHTANWETLRPKIERLWAEIGASLAKIKQWA